MKVWRALLLFLLTALPPAFALDREAFTITSYQLDVRIDRSSHVMAVTGRLVLRNDSKTPQKLVTLQVSSSLAWNGVAMNDQPLEWEGDNYTSDIDHTGSLSEAIVTLPAAVAPGASVTLDMQYGGTVTQDATRLTRLDAPTEVAARNDWDQIGDPFTAVRGLGYVTWYPVALNAVSLSEGSEVFDAIARWKNRHRMSEFDARLIVPASDRTLCIATNAAGSTCGQVAAKPADDEVGRTARSDLHLAGLEDTVPAFAIANYIELSRPTVELAYVADHKALAEDYALAAEANDSLLHEWLGDAKHPARIVELTDANANPYQNGAILFTPLRQSQTANLQLLLMPTLTAARFQSPRAWIQGGLERFLQAMSVENRVGRKAAMQFLDEYREPLVKAEEDAHPKNDAGGKAVKADEAANSLLNTSDELYLRGKASFVFWMLRDMVGDEAMQHTLAAYKPIADKDSGYFQHLVQTSGKRDLEWFFDDWVYRDRGLPEFHVESAYARPLLSENYKSFLVTVGIENRGHAGAEVPVLVETPSGTKTVRVLTKAGEKAVGRIEVPVAPREVQVNDGSVPEANLENNTYPVTASQP